MLDNCYASGMAESQVLAEDAPVPHKRSPVFCVATDDIVYLSTHKVREGREQMRRLDRELDLSRDYQH